jgi:hypothetical protein
VPLGALGVLGWAYAGPVRRLVRARRSAELAPLVDRQHEVIDALLTTGGHSTTARRAAGPDPVAQTVTRPPADPDGRPAG